MKIKSLHIDGFGALVNYSLNFNDELNSYFLNNGEGKTTIICFIKSMLFGLDKSNKKIDDRKLYFPKFASAFGGTGAAGFPTIARILHNTLKKDQDGNCVANIGGALVLPYFQFPPAPTDEEKEMLDELEKKLKLLNEQIEQIQSDIAEN